MIRNYIKIPLRNLTRSKGYAFINIAGLAVGISVALLIGMWVFDELSYNRHHDNYDRIAEVYQHQTVGDETITLGCGSMPLTAELKTTFKNDFRRVVMSWWINHHTLSVDDRRISQNGTFMEPEALEMFSFRMVKGTTNSLNDPASVILSESAAKALFGDEDPMEQSLRIDNMMDAKVTGVFRDFPHNARFNNLHFVSTWELWLASNDWLKAQENEWVNTGITFVELQPGRTFEDLSDKIKDTRRDKISKEQTERENPQLFLHPMSRWHLYSGWRNGEAENGQIQYVWLFTTIGVFVLLLACINFMNLSTAQSEKRAKEVGIRKSAGSVRGQLIYQFLTESFVVVVFAFLFSLVIVSVALPWFNDLAGKETQLLWSNPWFWLVSAAFILITSLLAGSYPALYLSSFQPVQVLKGTFKAGRLASVPRKVLVVIQFTVSITLIIGTIIVWQQVQFAKNRPVGYTREGLIMIRKSSPDFWGKFQVLKNELKASGAVLEVAESSSPATEVWFSNSGFNWRGKDPNLREDFATMAVTHEYGRTMGWKFIQGRDYSREFSTDSSAVILNESAVRFMGLTDPIDEEITWDGKKFKVIGVIQDMIMTSPYDPVKQTIFWLSYEGNVWINIRMNPAMSAGESLAEIEKVFRKVLPAVPFDYKFTAQEYALKFAGVERVGKLATVFATLAVFISCLGLFGLASFVAEQRRKEIGIRKILGASVANLWKMLSLEFVLLVSVSCLIGVPVAWYMLGRWLQKYQYHTELSPWIFVITCLGALTITLLTVSFQTLKASVVNPVESLKAE